MPKVWVLSQESPFRDESECGGCVIGVFATIAAAMLELVGNSIGSERLAEIQWEKYHEGAYHGYGDNDEWYFLFRYEVVEEEALRQEFKEDEARGWLIDPMLTLTSAELAAMVEPQSPEAIEAYEKRQQKAAAFFAKHPKLEA